MATQNTKKKSSSLQKNIKTKVFYLSMVTGFSLFGLYIAYDTYTLGLTMLNIFMTRLRLRNYLRKKYTQRKKN